MDINFSTLENLSNNELCTAILHHAQEMLKHPDNEDAMEMLEGILIEFMQKTHGISAEEAQEFVTRETAQGIATTLGQQFTP
jgi:hypothetical protein